MEKKLKLMSWNINGIRAATKKGFLDVLNIENPDVMCIQEIKAMKEQLNEEILNPEGYKSFWFSAKRKGYAGVACYSKTEPINVFYGMDKEEFDCEGRSMTLEFDDFFLINCYYPNAQHELARIDYKIAFNNAIREHADNLRKTKTVILTGDYNVAHKEIDIARPKANVNSAGFSKPERESMDKFISDGWIDTFRIFNDKPEQYTWWSYRGAARKRNVGWRLDYFCVNEEAKERILNASIQSKIYGSDHCPITIELH
ncbi:MAG: exodeoxyribonuclease III [Verrucomicrobiota bacterium]|nr:exodeoxyribonuclease III [Verrucomicrobiota bacterium]